MPTLDPARMDPARVPKRLLSLDGGGIRGLVEAEVLIEIENQLKEVTGKDRPLCEYFDLIGGTSTGAILAAGLALGLRATELRDFYLTFGKEVFNPEFIVVRLWHKYPAKPLENALKKVFGSNTTLGDAHLHTLLMIVSKNATLATTWFFINNPAGKYFAQNKDLPLWQLVRASAAAPTYFPPQAIAVADRGKSDRTYEFIDGGVTTYNNPSLQLFLEATEPSYGVGWQSGAENLLLISLGAGFSTPAIAPSKASDYNALDWARYVIEELMSDANLQQNVLMRFIGEHPVHSAAEATSNALALGGIPDTTTLDRMGSNLGAKKLLTYQRITIELSKPRLDRLGLSDIDPDRVNQLDCVDKMADLQRIGRAIAMEQVNMRALKSFFLAA